MTQAVMSIISNETKTCCGSVCVFVSQNVAHYEELQDKKSD
jgi:hypothetical protein